ncbi:MAG: acylneuraminate cytidylyltransferase family protein [Candidatus Riflebacteria bacterium]|nr:acylneuraminate cytidylyltransferase family protein [Candidatus Riflebacteria bacterium]
MLYAVIPVRAGSKRLPRKNIIDFCGKSLTARCIETARAANIFAKIFVSTDDNELADEAKKYGAEVPFIRPAELATDIATSLDVLLHALETVVNKQRLPAPSAVCLLQVTSPFLSVKHLIEAKNKFETENFNSLSSMRKVDQYVEWQYELANEKGKASPVDRAGLTKPSTLIPKRYIENGAIYFTKYDYLTKQKSMYDFDNHGAYIMSDLESLDVDTPQDFELAKAIESNFAISKK